MPRTWAGTDERWFWCGVHFADAAGYYSYKWAEVMAADAYAAFEEGEDERAVGARFRDTVRGCLRGRGMHASTCLQLTSVFSSWVDAHHASRRCWEWEGRATRPTCSGPSVGATHPLTLS